MHGSVDIVISEKIVLSDRAPVSAGSRLIAVGRNQNGIDTDRIRRAVKQKEPVRHEKFERIAVASFVVDIAVLSRRRKRRVMIFDFVHRPRIAGDRRSVFLYAVTAGRHKVNFVLKDRFDLVDIDGEVHFHATVHKRVARNSVFDAYAVVHVVSKVQAFFAERRRYAYFSRFARYIFVDREPAIALINIVVELAVERHVRVGIRLDLRVGKLVRRYGIGRDVASDCRSQSTREHKHTSCDFQ